MEQIERFHYLLERKERELSTQEEDVELKSLASSIVQRNSVRLSHPSPYNSKKLDTLSPSPRLHPLDFIPMLGIQRYKNSHTSYLPAHHVWHDRYNAHRNLLVIYNLCALAAVGVAIKVLKRFFNLRTISR